MVCVQSHCYIFKKHKLFYILTGFAADPSVRSDGVVEKVVGDSDRHEEIQGTEVNFIASL